MSTACPSRIRPVGTRSISTRFLSAATRASTICASRRVSVPRSHSNPTKPPPISVGLEWTWIFSRLPMLNESAKSAAAAPRTKVAAMTAARHGADAGLGVWAARHRLGVSAETIILRIGDEPGAHAVEIDVGGHGLADARRGLEQRALETLGP